MLQVEQRAGRYYLVCQTPVKLDETETTIQMDGDKILVCPRLERKGLCSPLESVIEDYGWIKAYQKIELLDVEVYRKQPSEDMSSRCRAPPNLSSEDMSSRCRAPPNLSSEDTLVGIMEMPVEDPDVKKFWLDPRTLTMLKKLCTEVKIIYYRLKTVHLHYDKVSELVYPIYCYYMIHNEYSESKTNRVAYATRNDPGTYVCFETWQPLEKILERLAASECDDSDENENEDDGDFEVDEELLDILEERQPFPLANCESLEFVPPKETHAKKSGQNARKVTFCTDASDEELGNDTGDEDTQVDVLGLSQESEVDDVETVDDPREADGFDLSGGEDDVDDVEEEC